MPGAPRALTAEAVSNTEVVLSWKDASDNETGFRIERAFDTATGMVWSELVTTTTNAQHWPVVDLKADTSYTFRVRPLNGTANSREATVRTLNDMTGSLPSVGRYGGMYPGWSGGEKYSWAPRGNPTEPEFAQAGGEWTGWHTQYTGDFTSVATYTSPKLARHSSISGGFDLVALNFWKDVRLSVQARLTEGGPFEEVFSDTYSIAFGEGLDPEYTWLDHPESTVVDYSWNGGDRVFFNPSFSFPHTLDTLELRVVAGGKFGIDEFGFGTWSDAVVQVDEFAGLDGREQGPANGKVTLKRSGGDLTKPLEVQYALSGTAHPGVDYQPFPDTHGGVGQILEAKFEANQTVLDLPINVIDDAWQERTKTMSGEIMGETVGVTVLPTRDYATRTPLQVEPHNAEIVDNDATPEPEPTTLPEISVEALDPTAAEPVGTTPADGATFVIKRTGSTAKPLDVYYLMSGMSEGVDAILPGQVPVGGQGQFMAHFSAGQREYVVHLQPRDNGVPNPERTAAVGVAADPSGKYQLSTTAPTTAQASVANPYVDLVEFLPAGQGKESFLDNELQRGELDDKNPDGSTNTNLPAPFFDDPTLPDPPFKGGWRIFPDATELVAAPHVATGRNVVRVRARVNGNQPTTVYFRAVDVDDPLDPLLKSQNPDSLINDNHLVDPNNNSEDNRGTPAGADLSWPGPQQVEAGYHGRLRRINEFGFAQQGAVVPVQAELAPDGRYYAEIDLAVSFAPGDNFRVLASTDQAEVASRERNAVPTEGENLSFLVHGALSPQLSVWRHVYIEQDWMSNSDARGELLGDRQQVTIGAGANAPTIGEDGPQTYSIRGFGAPDDYKTGHFVWNNIAYKIKDAHGDARTGRVVVDASAGQPLPAAGAVAMIYQDDFGWNAVEGAFDPVDPVPRADVANDEPLYQRMQPTARTTDNAFADAYIEPDLHKLDEFDNVIDGVTHAFAFDQVFDQNRGSKAFESDVFWVAYMSSAFEGSSDWDNDDDEVPPAEARAAGHTNVPISEVSLTYLETTIDWLGGAVDRPGLVAAHEVGHQFGVATGNGTDALGHREGGKPNIMAPVTNFLLARFRSSASHHFHPADVATLRDKIHSPGTPG